MKREVTRERNLPAVRLDTADLGLLWQRCCALFAEPADVCASVDIELPNESLEFSSVDELQAFAGLPSEVSKVKLWFSQGDRRIFIRSSGLLGSQPHVSCTGDSEAWCAGAVETVHSFLSNHRTAYSWFVTAPLGWIIAIVLYVAPLTTFLVGKLSGTQFQIPAPVAVGWLGTVAALSVLFFARHRVLPMFVVVLRKEDGFLKRRTAELTLLVALASAVLTIVGWFVTK